MNVSFYHLLKLSFTETIFLLSKILNHSTVNLQNIHLWYVKMDTDIAMNCSKSNSKYKILNGLPFPHHAATYYFWISDQQEELRNLLMCHVLSKQLSDYMELKKNISQTKPVSHQSLFCRKLSAERER